MVHFFQIEEEKFDSSHTKRENRRILFIWSHSSLNSSQISTWADKCHKVVCLMTAKWLHDTLERMKRRETKTMKVLMGQLAALRSLKRRKNLAEIATISFALISGNFLTLMVDRHWRKEMKKQMKWWIRRTELVRVSKRSCAIHFFIHFIPTLSSVAFSCRSVVNVSHLQLFSNSFYRVKKIK